MVVPFNDLSRPDPAIAGKLLSELQRVASGGWYALGPEVAAFEKEFGAYSQTRHMIGVANGTDALELALRAAGCGPGDEVILAPNAGFYSTVAARIVGAIPVYVDVAADTLVMDPASVREAVTLATKAVIVTHLYGYMADVRAIRAAIGNPAVWVIEDCAQAHGARLNGEFAGSLGEIGTYSFYPTKNLGAFGDGGAVGTQRDDIAEKLRALRQYGWSEKYISTIPGGRNSRLDEIQAVVLRQKLTRLEEGNRRRRWIVEQYRAAVAGTEATIPHRAEARYVGHLCIALHPRRDAWRKRLADAGVHTAIHYPLLDFDQPSLQGAAFRALDTPVAKRLTAEIVSLPCFPELTDAEVTHVCDALRACRG
jgi:dTDP-4-amino-4,6-dideoxygalactose transaminase